MFRDVILCPGVQTDPYYILILTIFRTNDVSIPMTLRCDFHGTPLSTWDGWFLPPVRRIVWLSMCVMHAGRMQSVADQQGKYPLVRTSGDESLSLTNVGHTRAHPRQSYVRIRRFVITDESNGHRPSAALLLPSPFYPRQPAYLCPNHHWNLPKKGIKHVRLLVLPLAMQSGRDATCRILSVILNVYSLSTTFPL